MRRRQLPSFSIISCALVMLLPGAAAHGRPNDAERAATQLVRRAEGLVLEARATSRGDVEAEERVAAAWRLADALLAGAARLQPRDAALARRRLAAADFVPEADRFVRLATLVRLDPDDGRRMLELLEMAIGRLPDAEARLAALERATGAAGDELPPGVRSRLAEAASRLHDERLRETEAARRLELALDLDPTNRDAASRRVLAADLDPAGNGLELLDALVDLFDADPLNVAVASDLGALLLESDSASAAETVFRHALDVSDALGGATGRPPVRETILAAVAAEGPEAGEARITRIASWSDAPERDPVLAAWRVFLLDHMTEAETDAEAAETTPRPDLRQDRIDRLESAEAAAASRASEGGPSPSSSVASARERLARRLVWVGDVPADLVEAAALDDPEADADRADLLRGWIALRRGDDAEARRLLASREDAWSEAGLALLDDREGDTVTAVRRLVALREAHSGTGLGMWARLEAEDRLGRRLPPREAARERGLEAEQAIARWRGLLEDPDRAVRLEVAAPEAAVGPGEPIELVLRLRSVTSHALPLRPDGPIGTRAVLRIVPREAGRRVDDAPAPLLLDFDRAFVLQPGAETTITLDLHRTALGRWLDERPWQRLDLELRAALDHPVVLRPERRVSRHVGGRTLSPPVELVRGPRVLEEVEIRTTLSGTDAAAVDLWLDLVTTSGPDRPDFDGLDGLLTDASERLATRARAWSAARAARVRLALGPRSGVDADVAAPVRAALAEHPDPLVRLARLASGGEPAPDDPEVIAGSVLHAARILRETPPRR